MLNYKGLGYGVMGEPFIFTPGALTQVGKWGGGQAGLAMCGEP